MKQKRHLKGVFSKVAGLGLVLSEAKDLPVPYWGEPGTFLLMAFPYRYRKTDTLSGVGFR